jgi:hypothetical protein
MKRMAWFGVAFLFWVGASWGSGDDAKSTSVEAPKSLMAVTALNKVDLAVKKADEAYVQAVLAAKRQCLKELDAAIKQAMQGTNLDEANRISAARKLVAADVEQLVAGSKPGAGNLGGRGKLVYLEELEEESVKGSQWALTKGGKIQHMPIVVGDVKSPHGMGLNPIDGASARITYQLKGQYRRLTGAAAINDSSKGWGGTIIFKVVGDGRELWKYRMVAKAGVPFPFDVDVSRVTTLELVSECPGGAAGAHVVWLEPQLTER